MCMSVSVSYKELTRERLARPGNWHSREVILLVARISTKVELSQDNFLILETSGLGAGVLRKH